jgi:hypothetical protein
MVWLTATADELDAVARRLGADRFPGVAQSIFDTTPTDLHQLLAERFTATLQARRLVAEQGGRLVLAPAAAALLDPVVTGPVRYAVHCTGDDREAASMLAVGHRGEVVWHRVRAQLHRFDLLGTDGDVAAALCRVLGLPAPPAAGARRAASRPRGRIDVAGSRLAGHPPPADRWQAVTIVQRVDDVGTSDTDAAVAVSWLAVVDAGPDGLVTVTPAGEGDALDPDADPLLAVTPTDPPALAGRLASWCGPASPG